uniref:Uncharacterized protein n=1 Tax=Norrisiella sphaerica TaxID=552664 RepID=A0A7S2QSN7_9EUKA|mmetsp:Transcript_200/g.281  ORF Transcript_200/g.281 Transcript_200/m.281 type:complete len:141 (+) Transcript_200:207-629(+)
MKTRGEEMTDEADAATGGGEAGEEVGPEPIALKIRGVGAVAVVDAVAVAVVEVRMDQMKAGGKEGSLEKRKTLFHMYLSSGRYLSRSRSLRCRRQLQIPLSYCNINEASRGLPLLSWAKVIGPLALALGHVIALQSRHLR